jgi:hypothetical protein
MKKPMQSAKSAGHASFSSSAGVGEGAAWVMGVVNTRPWTMLP